MLTLFCKTPKCEWQGPVSELSRLSTNLDVESMIDHSVGPAINFPFIQEIFDGKKDYLFCPNCECTIAVKRGSVMKFFMKKVDIKGDI